MANLISIPFGLMGNIYRSPMPGSNFDINKTTFSEFIQSDINTVVMLNSKAEAQIYSGNQLISKYDSLGLNSIYFPINDFDTPENESNFLEMINEIITVGKNGKNVAIHCYAGLGRTGTVLAILARKILNIDGTEAVDLIRSHVPNAIQTASQVNYIFKFPIEKLDK